MSTAYGLAGAAQAEQKREEGDAVKPVAGLRNELGNPEAREVGFSRE
jgi:hypothetical protein